MKPRLRVEIRAEVLRRIRQHARSSMSAEICGVLIGAVRDQVTVVEESIEGEQARQGGSHVTFTQDTWSHIYKMKDSKYPDKRIVGWYHSHPGFGVFLSDHDTFIQRNFFSGEDQIAWVYDPHSDEEGCFAWEKNEIVRLPAIAVRDEPSPVAVRRSAVEPEDPFPSERPPRKRRLARWMALVLSHLLVLILGFGIAVFLLPQVIVIPDSGSSVQKSK